MGRMRAAAWAVTAIVLLCLGSPLAGQTPTQLPGQAAPVTPGATAETQADKDKKAGIAASGRASGEDQQFFEVKVGFNHTKIDPNLRDEFGRPLRSFLTPGKNVTADFSYFMDHGFGTNRVQVLSIFRSNNDPRVDPEQNSLQRGYLRLSTPNSEWSAGDALVSYSRLTFNQNIKGLSFTRKFGDVFKLQANGGVFTDRWGSVWKDDLLGKPFTRAVAGLRAEARIDRDNAIGFNFSHGRDLESSIRPDLRQFGLIPLNNDIGSVDARLSFFRMLAVDGELAYSTTNFDTRLYNYRRKDYGGRLDTSLRAGRFFLRTSYVRLMPDFLSLNARQLADLQDAMVRAGVDVTGNISVEGTYRRTNNNLRGQRPEGTTIFRMPEVRVSFHNVPLMGKSIVDIGYRERQQRGPIRAVQPNAGRPENRNVPIPFVEVVVPLGNTMISVGYEHRGNENHTAPADNTKANRWSGSLRSNFNLGNWNFAPMFRYEMEREEFFRLYGFNTNRSMLASAYVDAPKYFAFDISYRMLGASLFAECVQVEGGAPCNPFLTVVPGTSVLLPSGFRRPAFHAALTYKIRNNEDRFIVFSFDRNTNFFALPGRDFKERVVAVTLVFRLKK